MGFEVLESNHLLPSCALHLTPSSKPLDRQNHFCFWDPLQVPVKIAYAHPASPLAKSFEFGRLLTVNHKKSADFVVIQTLSPKG